MSASVPGSIFIIVFIIYCLGIIVYSVIGIKKRNITIWWRRPVVYRRYEGKDAVRAGIVQIIVSLVVISFALYIFISRL